MKKLFVTCCAFAALNAAAQIKEIVINVAGGYDVIVEPSPGQRVAVTETGYIVDIRLSDSDGRAPLQGQETPSVPSLPVTYYAKGKGVKNMLVGKVHSIGGIVFEYSTRSAAYGKLQRVGGIPIEYNRLFSGKGPMGKVARIGDVYFSYYELLDQGVVHEPGGGMRYGLIKTINGLPYQYFFPFSPGSGSGAAYGNKLPSDVRITGKMELRVGDVTVHVLDGIPPAHVEAYYARMETDRRRAVQSAREEQVKKEAEIRAKAEAEARIKAEEEARKKRESEKKPSWW